MATRSEPNLRVVKSASPNPRDPSGHARSTAESRRDDGALSASSAPGIALAQGAAGEILIDHSITHEPGKHATLVGMGAPAAKHGIDRSQLFVSPSTVTAISRAGRTRYPTEPKVMVQMEPLKKLHTTDVIPLTKKKEPARRLSMGRALETPPK